jgi:YHS domain-containing protein
MTNAIIKDPVCGRTVQPSKELTASYNGHTSWFCSECCRDTFLEYPERYVPAFVTLNDDAAKEHRCVSESSYTTRCATCEPFV